MSRYFFLIIIALEDNIIKVIKGKDRYMVNNRYYLIQDYI